MMKMIRMRVLKMGRVGVFMIGSFFKRGMVQGVAHQLVKCVFNVFDVFLGDTIVLESLNEGIEPTIFGIKGHDVLLVMDVVSNQGIEFLVTGGFHLDIVENGKEGLQRKINK
jgi:hypothetical protein